MCVFRSVVGVRRVRVVIIIRRWSELSVYTVRHVVYCSSFGEQKVDSCVVTYLTVDSCIVTYLTVDCCVVTYLAVCCCLLNCSQLCCCTCCYLPGS